MGRVVALEEVLALGRGGNMVVHAPWPATSVVSTKLLPPRLPSDHVVRRRLHERLNAGIGRKLTLVCAPAGFGKTTLLAGWLRADPRPSAWLSLDEHDDDLAAFMQAFVEALRAIGPAVGRAALSLLPQNSDPPLRYLSDMLVDDVIQVGQSIVIVLDDFHLIRNPAVHGLLAAMLRRMPPNLQLVLSSRTVPSLSITALRGRGELSEVNVHDLRFELAEAERFLDRASNQTFSHAEVRGLHAQAEGWAVLLRIAAMEGDDSPGPAGESSPSIAAIRRSVDGYLLDEVLDRQSPELRRFLLQISVLERFCAPLCDALVDGDAPGDGRRLLDQIEQMNLFLVALDDEHRWYRFHDMFRDMLRRRLEREVDRSALREIHARASAWLAAEDHVEEALQHALVAGDVAGAASIIEQNVMGWADRREWITIDTWLRRLPADIVNGRPLLAFAQMRVLTLGTDFGALSVQVATLDRLLAQFPTDAGPEINSMRAMVAATRSFMLIFVGGDDQQANECAARAVQWLPSSWMHTHPNVDVMRGSAGELYVVSEQILGRGTSALAWIDDELRQAGDRHPAYVARMLVGQAYAEFASGLLPQLEHTTRQLIRITTEHRLATNGAWAHLLAAHLAYEWNDLEAARQLSVEGLVIGDHANLSCSLSLTLRLALTLLAAGRPDEARRLALDALELAEKTNRQMAIESLRSFEARLALASGDLEAAAHWIESVSLNSRPTLAYEVEDPRLTRVRVLLVRATEASLAEAATVVADALAIAEARHMLPRILEALTLRALIEQAREDIDAALQTLNRAVTLAEPGRFTRTFLDLGSPMSGLLARLARLTGDPSVRAAARRLVTATHSAVAPHEPSLPSRAPSPPDDVEPLTWREQEVLHLLDARYSNKEIAVMLCISFETVKRHAANIYGKLQVAGRRDAVERGHQLGLLRNLSVPAS